MHAHTQSAEKRETIKRQKTTDDTEQVAGVHHWVLLSLTRNIIQNTVNEWTTRIEPLLTS